MHPKARRRLFYDRFATIICDIYTFMYIVRESGDVQSRSQVDDSTSNTIYGEMNQEKRTR